MTIHDDGDGIRAVGFVTVYYTYLENNLIGLIKISEQFITLSENLLNLSLNNQATVLKKELKKQFNIAPHYPEKEFEFAHTLETLEDVKKIAQKRNKVIHSPLISNGAGIIIQENRRKNSSQPITSAQIYDLANDIRSLTAEVYGLQFYIFRLRQSLCGSKP